METKIKNEIAEHALRMEEVQAAMAKNLDSKVVTAIEGSAAKEVATAVKSEINQITVEDIKGSILKEDEVMKIFTDKEISNDQAGIVAAYVKRMLDNQKLLMDEALKEAVKKATKKGEAEEEGEEEEEEGFALPKQQQKAQGQRRRKDADAIIDDGTVRQSAIKRG